MFAPPKRLEPQLPIPFRLTFQVGLGSQEGDPFRDLIALVSVKPPTVSFVLSVSALVAVPCPAGYPSAASLVLPFLRVWKTVKG